MTLTEGLIQIGGKRWTYGNHDRVYMNDVISAYCEAIGLTVVHYGTGNIRSAMLNGRHISNSSAVTLLNRVPDRFWYDVNDNKFHAKYLISIPGNDTSGIVNCLETYYRGKLDMITHP